MQINLNKETLLGYYHRAQVWLWQPHRRPYTVFGGTLLFVIFLVMTKPAGESKDLPDPSAQVESILISPQPLDTTLFLYGTIETPAKFTVMATVTSNVLETPLKEGAPVFPGDVLISLDPAEPELILQQRDADVYEIEGQLTAENNRHKANLQALEHEKKLLALLTKALERQQKLSSQGLNAQANVDNTLQDTERQALIINAREHEIADHEARLTQLEARLSKAKALRAQAALDLERTKIRSTFVGRVALLHVAAYDRVTPGTPLLDLYDTQALEVRAQIPTKYLPQLHEQLKQGVPILAKATLDGETIPLELERLSGDVQPGRGGVDALFKVKQSSPTLALGRPVELLLSLKNQTPVIAIPYTALHSYDRVFKIVDNTLQGVTVTRFGERINDRDETELLVTSKELVANDRILTSLLPNATTGMKVHDH
jgi:multidrug efflux pump subunit AcrA (membrane-fusion protein)